MISNMIYRICTQASCRKSRTKATQDKGSKQTSTRTYILVLRRRKASRTSSLLTQQFLLACRKALLPRELSLLGDGAHKGVARSARRHSIYYCSTRQPISVVPRIIAHVLVHDRCSRFSVFSADNEIIGSSVSRSCTTKRIFYSLCDIFFGQNVSCPFFCVITPCCLGQTKSCVR